MSERSDCRLVRARIISEVSGGTTVHLLWLINIITKDYMLSVTVSLRGISEGVLILKVIIMCIHIIKEIPYYDISNNNINYA